MKKIITTIVLFIAAVSSVSAQNQANQSVNASQSTRLALSNAIDISFYTSFYGGTQTMSFNNVNDYANGVETGWQVLIVKSNKNYDVTVKSNSSTFSYSGNTSPAPSMPISALNVGLFYNGTGGTVSSTFANKFAPMAETPQTIITNGAKGGFQYFFTRYKATPGFAYPAGTYTAEVIYTATQK